MGASDAPGNAEAAHGPKRNVGERLDEQVRRSGCGAGLVAGAPRFPDSLQFWSRGHAKPEPRPHPRHRRDASGRVRLAALTFQQLNVRLYRGTLFPIRMGIIK